MASGDYGTYAILAASDLNLTATGNKANGDIGYYTTSGSGTIAVSGATNIGTDIDNALSYANAVYTDILTYTPDTTSGASNIGGATFNPGVNELSSSSLTIGGATPVVTLDGSGTYLFQVPNGGLTTDPTSAPVKINLTNGAQASNVYWLINGSVNLQTIAGNTSSFVGIIISQNDITMGTNSINAGAAISLTGSVTLDNNTLTSLYSQQIFDNMNNNYINIATTLPDSQAIRINAASDFGGILMSAGTGGITVNSGNVISLNAEAAANLSTTFGNVLVQSSPAIVSLDGGVAVNIGCDANFSGTGTPVLTPEINIGNSSSSKVINIGKFYGTTEVNVLAGSGDITIESSSGKVDITGNDSSSTAITLDASAASNGITLLSSTGGLTANSSGKTQLISTDTSVDAIRLDTSGSSGGVFVAAGSSGIQIGNDGVSHPLTIGNTVSATAVSLYSGSGGITSIAGSGKNQLTSSNTSVDAIRLDSSASSGGVFIAAGSSGIQIGNDGVDHPIIIGNTTGTSLTQIQSGSWGLTIGNYGSGEVQIANGGVAKRVTVGNSVTNSTLVTRWQSAWIKHQEDEVPLGDTPGPTVLSIGNVFKGLFVGPTGGTLSSNNTLELDTAGTIIAAFGAANDNDAVEFTIVNTSSVSDYYYELTMGTGGTMVGNAIVYPVTNTGYNTSGSATFRIVISVTNTTYKVYRIS